MEWSDAIAEPDGSTPWPTADADLFHEESDWWATACLDWPRDRSLGYIDGYWKAAEIICERISNTHRDQDKLVYPFVMCWRHYVELHLKTLIELARHYFREPHTLLKTHRIDLLWKEARLLLVRVFPGADNSDFKNVDRLLTQLHVLDPTSEHFRYPVRNDGSATLDGVSRIHVRNFHNVMIGVANLLASVDAELRRMIDIECAGDGFGDGAEIAENS